MIFTDRFVYIHQPKTGGTFVTTMLYRVHQVKRTESLWRRTFRLLGRGRLTGPERGRRYEGRYGLFHDAGNKHGKCFEIPEAHRGKLILSTIRNPFDRYVSEYEFGWWKKPEYLEYYRRVPGFEERYGHFPELSFEEFVHLRNSSYCKSRVDGAGVEPLFGMQTEQFVQFYFDDPDTIRPRMDDHYFASGRYEEDMFPVRFLRTDRLNEDLYEFLVEMGYHPEDLECILESGIILPGGRVRREQRPWSRYYTPELARWVREKERILFELFPEFDVAPEVFAP